MLERPIRLIIVANVYRPDLGGGVLFADLCEGLAERGFDVTVKCAYSYYPEWKDKSGNNGWKIRSTLEQGVCVERHGLYIPSNPNSLLQRLLYEASFYLSLRRKRPARGGTDAIMVFCPLIGSVAYGVAARRRSGAPLWLNVQDLSAQAAVAGGLSGPKRVGQLFAGIQRRLFGRADYWSSISPPMVQTLQSLRSSGSVDLIPNFMHRSLETAIRAAQESAVRNQTTETTAASSADDDHPLRSVPRLFYSGNLGGKQNLKAFCKRLAQSDAPFEFRIHAEGSGMQELQQWAREHADNRFTLAGLTDEKALAEALVASHFYVITEREGAGSAFIPSKLIPCITAGTPILAVCDKDSPLGQEVLGHGLGPHLAWSELDDVEEVLLQRGEKYATWKSNALKRSAYYSRDTAIDRYEAMFHRMLKEQSNVQ